MPANFDPLETPFYDGKAAQRGYALNAMCFSLNEAAHRARFLVDPYAYCDRYGLNREQREAVMAHDIGAMIRAGGNTYYLLKLANLWGMDVQDVGAQQTGQTRAEFQRQLEEAGA